MGYQVAGEQPALAVLRRPVLVPVPVYASGSGIRAGAHPSLAARAPP